jgi:hypothetical protein
MRVLALVGPNGTTGIDYADVIADYDPDHDLDELRIWRERAEKLFTEDEMDPRCQKNYCGRSPPKKSK